MLYPPSLTHASFTAIHGPGLASSPCQRFHRCSLPPFTSKPKRHSLHPKKRSFSIFQAPLTLPTPAPIAAWIFTRTHSAAALHFSPVCRTGTVSARAPSANWFGSTSSGSQPPPPPCLCSTSARQPPPLRARRTKKNEKKRKILIFVSHDSSAFVVVVAAAAIVIIAVVKFLSFLLESRMLLCSGLGVTASDSFTIPADLDNTDIQPNPKHKPRQKN